MIDRKSNTPPSTTNSSVRHNTGYSIWHVVNMWQKTQKDALAPFNMTPVQFLLIAGLTELSVDNSTIKQSALAQYCRTDAMMFAYILCLRLEPCRKPIRSIYLILKKSGKDAQTNCQMGII